VTGAGVREGLGALFEEGDHLEANQLVCFEIHEQLREFMGVGTRMHLPDNVGPHAGGRSEHAEEVAPHPDGELGDAAPKVHGGQP
jgi:hypothetical protein